MGAEQILLAAINILLGGVTVKIIDCIISQAKLKTDDAMALRQELWTEVHKNREALVALEHEVDTWKDKYYSVYQKLGEVQLELDKLKSKQ